MPLCFNPVLASRYLVPPAGTVGDLVPVASNDDCLPGQAHSCVKVFGLAGQEYALQLDGFGRQQGTGVLTASASLAPLVSVEL